jgi:hypothetical protein
MVVGAVTNMEEGSGDALLFRGGKFGQYQPIEITAPAQTEAAPVVVKSAS